MTRCCQGHRGSRRGGGKELEGGEEGKCVVEGGKEGKKRKGREEGEEVAGEGGKLRG